MAAGPGYAAANEAATGPAWDCGLRVLQGFRLGQDDAGHVGELLRLMAPPKGAHVADVGCGFGEVARLMVEARPDLRFSLVNLSAAQLARCPADLPRVQADLHRLPFGAGAFDGVMILYTLCHADLSAALAEAARVTRRGGFLFVFDYERVSGDGREAEAVLYAAWHRREALQYAARRAGWWVQWMINPAGSDAVFRGLFNDAAAYARVFGGVRPIVWRARRL